MARILDGLPFWSDWIEKLLRARRQGEMVGTHALVGTSSQLLSELALGLAQTLVCEVQLEACGECGPCRRLQARASESALVVSPEKNLIRAEAAQSIREFLQLRALGRHRVVVVEEAHLFSPVAANQLLKTLEEPSSQVCFFLLAPSRHHLLPTLASRARVWRTPPLNLRDHPQFCEAPPWVVSAAAGRPEMAQILKNASGLELRSQAWEVLKAILRSPTPLVLGELLSEKPRAGEFFFWIRSFVRDGMILLSVGLQAPLKNEDLRADLTHLLQETSIDVESLVDVLRGFQECETQWNSRDTLLALEGIWAHHVLD